MRTYHVSCGSMTIPCGPMSVKVVTLTESPLQDLPMAVPCGPMTVPCGPMSVQVETLTDSPLQDLPMAVPCGPMTVPRGPMNVILQHLQRVPCRTCRLSWSVKEEMDLRTMLPTWDLFSCCGSASVTEGKTGCHCQQKPQKVALEKCSKKKPLSLSLLASY